MNQSTRLYLVYQKDVKKVRTVKLFSELLDKAQKAFTNLPSSYKFYYEDEDEDLLTVSVQEDLDEALYQAKLVLVIASNKDQAYQYLKMQHVQKQMGSISTRSNAEDTTFVNDFEELTQTMQSRQQTQNNYNQPKSARQNYDQQRYQNQIIMQSSIASYDDMQRLIDEKTLVQSQIVADVEDQVISINNGNQKPRQQYESKQNLAQIDQQQQEQFFFQLKADLMTQFKEQIQNEMATALKSQIQQQQTQVQQSLLNQSIHESIQCNECQISPISGDRYFCQICKNYNLCSLCEQTTRHPHPFTKLKTPEQAQKFMESIVYLPEQISKKSENSKQKEESKIAEVIIKPMIQLPQPVSARNPPIQSEEFIQESHALVIPVTDQKSQKIEIESNDSVKAVIMPNSQWSYVANHIRSMPVLEDEFEIPADNSFVDLQPNNKDDFYRQTYLTELQKVIHDAQEGALLNQNEIAKRRENLVNLMEHGFYNINLNIILLQQCKDNLNQVLNLIFSEIELEAAVKIKEYQQPEWYFQQ